MPAIGSWTISAVMFVETFEVRSGKTASQLASISSTGASGQEVISTTSSAIRTTSKEHSVDKFPSSSSAVMYIIVVFEIEVPAMGTCVRVLFSEQSVTLRPSV